MSPSARAVGEHIRNWRQRRRLTQLDLALEAEISTRHLSFVETGRAAPSRDMVLNLAECLSVPLRDRNLMLVAAGFAPIFAERPLDDPDLQHAKAAVDLLLRGHEPYPALAVDRLWTVVAMNGAVAPLLAGVSPDLLAPPVNALRLSLHPQGLAPRVRNLAAWRGHLLARLARQVELTADPALVRLLSELSAYPRPPEAARRPGRTGESSPVVVPLRLDTEAGAIALFSTTTVFGTPVDITLSEIAIESFFPADPESAAVLRRLSGPT